VEALRRRYEDQGNPASGPRPQHTERRSGQGGGVSQVYGGPGATPGDLGKRDARGLPGDRWPEEATSAALSLGWEEIEASLVEATEAQEEEPPIEWVWRLEVGRFVVGWKRRG